MADAIKGANMMSFKEVMQEFEEKAAKSESATCAELRDQIRTKDAQIASLRRDLTTAIESPPRKAEVDKLIAEMNNIQCPGNAASFAKSYSEGIGFHMAVRACMDVVRKWGVQ